MKRNTILLSLFSTLFIIAGCTPKVGWMPVSGTEYKTIAAPILDIEGKKIGEAVFSETGEGVSISIEAEGLPPGLHGTHIHEKGECTPPGFESAGGHFNPTSKQHGYDNPKGFHAGDLPNIVVEADRDVKITLTTKEFTLMPNVENSLLDADGSSLVIHEKVDDYKTDPSGDSGARIACAAINP
ncbi:superoxide dismutase family protein [Sporosarcina sp. CAU 1771]